MSQNCQDKKWKRRRCINNTFLDDGTGILKGSGGALFGRNLNNIRLNHCTYCGIAMSVQQSTLLWNCYECGRVWTSVCLGTLRNASWGFLIA